MESVNRYPSASGFLDEIHARLPLGTTIYQKSTLVISDFTHSASFPGDATYYRDAAEIKVTYNGVSRKFPATWSIAIQDGSEYYVNNSLSINHLLKTAHNDLAPLAITRRSTPPEIACNCNPVIPGDGGDGSMHSYMFVLDRLQGVVTSFSGSPADGFDFTFDNPFSDGANYTYTYELYDANGSPMTTITSSAQLFGPSGDVWFAIPSQYQASLGSIMVMITVNQLGGNSAAPGNAHLHKP